MEVVNLDEFVHAVIEQHEDKKAANDEIYQQLENGGYISKVTLHRFICANGCGPRATVVRVGPLTLIRTEDYKFSPGYNESHSAPTARVERTLDGRRHWPKQTIDVDDLAGWGGAAQIQVPCRHRVLMVDPVDLLEQVKRVVPGHPGAPTRL